MIRALAFLAAGLALSADASAQDPLAGERARLAAAKRASAEAGAKAAALARAALAERNAAARAAREEAAVAARIARAEADVAAGRARLAIVDALLARQRARLSGEEAPAGKLLGALQALARRPAVATIAQPGSIDDAIHLQAVLGSVLPAIRARTATLRRAVAETRGLRNDAVLAANALRADQVALRRERAVLAGLRLRHSSRATSLGRDALAQSDRAIALGEAARDTVDRMTEFGSRQEVAAALSRLPGPPPVPPVVAPAPGPYRLPVTGSLVTGFGELSPTGIRARGLTFAVVAGQAIIAPAAGTVVFARPFRGYGTVIIIDHGAGWASAISGLSRAAVRNGDVVSAGRAIGAAGTGERPEVTVELYRRRRAVDLAALIG